MLKMVDQIKQVMIHIQQFTLVIRVDLKNPATSFKLLVCAL